MQLSNTHICNITLPVLISLLLESLISTIDSVFLARIGIIELAALALGGSYYLVIYMIGIGFSFGAQILMARYNGSQQYQRIGEVFTQGILFLLLTATLFSVLFYFCSPMILRYLIYSEEIRQATQSYLNWRLSGLFFSFPILMFGAFFIGTRQSWILVASSLTILLAKLTFNFPLIFGIFGLPGLGISGAAIASTISEATAVFLLFMYIRSEASLQKFCLLQSCRIHADTLKKVLNTSVWTILLCLLVSGIWFMLHITAKSLGEISLGATNLVHSISSFLFIFILAFAWVSSSLAGNLIGEGKAVQVMQLCKKAILLCYAFVLPLILVIAIYPSVILGIFTENGELIACSIPPLLVMLSACLIKVPAFVWFCAVAGTGHTLVSFGIAGVSVLIYIAYTEVISYCNPNVALLWTSEHICFSSLLILSLLFLLRYKRKQAKLYRKSEE